MYGVKLSRYRHPIIRTGYCYHKPFSYRLILYSNGNIFYYRAKLIYDKYFMIKIVSYTVPGSISDPGGSGLESYFQKV